MAKKIMIFAGAGASKAVNSEKFPTTVDFFNNLSDDIKNNSLYSYVIKYLKKNDSERIIDVEELLWELRKLKRFCQYNEDDYGIVAYSVYNQNLSSLVGQHNHSRYGQLSNDLSMIEDQCERLIDEINAVVYDLYGYEPEAHELDNNWLYLIKSLTKKNIKFDIFTTNYDLSIETAIGEESTINEDEFFGVIGNRKKKINFEKWINVNNSHGLLTKLHGSIDWKKNNLDINISDTNFTRVHDNHAIIYPGFKGKSELSFFKPLHDYFSRQLNSTECIIFIGFAFRDDYINNLIRERMNRNAKVFIIDYKNEVNFPINTIKVINNKDRFCIKSVDDFMSSLIL